MSEEKMANTGKSRAMQREGQGTRESLSLTELVRIVNFLSAKLVGFLSLI
jgi:hypothetical protein